MIDFAVNPLEPEVSFARLANELMNKHELNINEHLYRLTEIEFYYFHEELHPDTTVHRGTLQKRTGKWYVHRTKGGKSFKTGKRKGIDITFGDPGAGTYGGILLRAMQNMGNEAEYIYGPSKLMDKIMELNVITDDQLEILDGSDIFSNERLSIQVSENIEPEVVYNCPRVGIHQGNHPRYYFRDYRYFIFPRKRHDGKELLIAKKWMEAGKYSPGEINEIIGYRYIKEV